MALLDVADVVTSVAALLDDPSGSEIDVDYVLPFLNLRWSNLVTNLVMLGLQYSEEVVILTIQPGTVTLSDAMQSGAPLASLMKPKSIDWKPVGTADTLYTPAAQKNELSDVDPSSTGVLEYSFQGGTIQVTPSAVAVVARIRFLAMSTSLVDPSDGMIRGVGDIIAYRTAEMIAAVRGGATALKQACKEWGDTALDDFLAMSTMAQQATYTRISGRRSAPGSFFVARVLGNS